MPSDPENGFESVEAARQWVQAFAVRYNTEHRHSGINYVTPEQRHNDEDIAILAQHQAVYAEAKARSPRRWSRQIRDWTPGRSLMAQPRQGAPRVRPERGGLSEPRGDRLLDRHRAQSHSTWRVVSDA